MGKRSRPTGSTYPAAVQRRVELRASHKHAFSKATLNRCGRSDKLQLRMAFMTDPCAFNVGESESVNRHCILKDTSPLYWTL